MLCEKRNIVAAVLMLAITWLMLATNVRAQTDFSVTNQKNWDWNETDWSLTTERFNPGQYQARQSLSNGYFGASLAVAGPFFEVDTNQTDPAGLQPLNGWPLFSPRISFATLSGFYNIQPNGSGTNYPWLNQYGWESFIAGIPHPTAIQFAFGDSYLDATVKNTSLQNFKSGPSFRRGLATWSYNWVIDDASFEVTYETVFSRKRPNVAAVKATICSTADINGTVTDLIDGRSAVRSYLNAKAIDGNGTIYTSVHPDGLVNVTAYVVSGLDVSGGYVDASSAKAASGPGIPTNDTTIAQSYDISLKAGQTATFYKYIGAASNDQFPQAESTARSEQAAAAELGWDSLLKEHEDEWAAIMTPESVDDFADPVTGKLPEDINVQILHISAIASTYYLLQMLQPDGSGLNDDSIAVGGLVSDSYAGLIFWDADYWMAPGLNLNFPNLAKQIANFRVKQHPQALANAEFNNYTEGASLYSWTAGRYGNCTGTGPCVDYEYHLNPDITNNMLQLRNVTGNDTWFENGPLQVLNSTAIMFSELLEYNETTKTYWIKNMTDPDEYANNKDNGVFTIASAGETLKQANWILFESQGLPINDTWLDQQENVQFPRAESEITLEYQTMNNSVEVKQADVVLVTYPLDYGESNYTAEQKLLDLDYYANKQSPDGPAMTYSIFAINANSLSPSGCSAYTYTLGGSLAYLRAPFFQFSEQNNDNIVTNGNQNPAFPFLTGHGGANQVAPFGFLGIRTDQPTLFIDPSLPPQIPHLRLRNFYYAGATLAASLNSTHTTLTRLETDASAGLTDSYANTTMPITVGNPSTSASDHTVYDIAINTTIYIPNRLYWQNLTVPKNLLQCLAVTSDDPYAPGQFPVAAIDGATATRWQPASNESASLLVNMTSTSPSKVEAIYFDWGARPPRSARVEFGNMTDGKIVYGDEVYFDIVGITPSLPFDAEVAAKSSEEVVPVQGNTTEVSTAGATWSGNYARFTIEGCWEEDGKGATVGEFVVIGA